MKISKIEFEQFWDQVLGRDWYVDDDYPFDDPEVLIGDFDTQAVCWQGSGSPQPSSFIYKSDLRAVGLGVHLGISIVTLFQRWRKAQTTTVVLAQFTVPKENLEQVLAAIKELGGNVIMR